MESMVNEQLFHTVRYEAEMVIGNRKPETVYEAKFSLPYAVAAGLIFGRARFNAFNDKSLTDERIRKIMPLIDFEVDPSAEEKFPNYRSAMVRVETTDGRYLKHHSPTRKGDPDDPLTDTELEEKFFEFVEPVIGTGTARALLEDCWNLEKIDAVSSLSYR